MSESTTIRWDLDADGIVVLTLDDPDQSANTMNAATCAGHGQCATEDTMPTSTAANPAHRAKRPGRKPSMTNSTSARPNQSQETSDVVSEASIAVTSSL